MKTDAAAFPTSQMISTAITHRRQLLNTFDFRLNLPKTLSSSPSATASVSTIEIEPLQTEIKPSLPEIESSVPVKKVLIPIGLGTEEMETVIMVNVLHQPRAEVILASVEAELRVKLSGGTLLVADVSITECSDQMFDLVAIPGGMPGSVRLRDCKALEEITKKQAEEKRLYMRLFVLLQLLHFCPGVFSREKRQLVIRHFGTSFRLSGPLKQIFKLLRN